MLILRKLKERLQYKMSKHTKVKCVGNLSFDIPAGPESLEDYFQKDTLLGQEAALHLWYVDTRPNSQKPFPSI